MFPIVEAAYHARGGKSPRLPGRAELIWRPRRCPIFHRRERRAVSLQQGRWNDPQSDWRVGILKTATKTRKNAMNAIATAPANCPRRAKSRLRDQRCKPTDRMKRVLVTGATGQIGRQVVDQLLGTDCRIRALTRNPESADRPAASKVRGDLAVLETHRCLPGASRRYFAPGSPRLRPRRRARRTRRIRPSRAAHVSTTVRIRSNSQAMMTAHVGIERLIKASGLTRTFQRPTSVRAHMPAGGRRRSRTASRALVHGCAGRRRFTRATSSPSPARARGNPRRLHPDRPRVADQRDQVQIIGQAIGRPLS